MKGYKPGVTRKDVDALKLAHKKRHHENMKQWGAEAKSAALKKMMEKSEPLNAWGQDAKAAKAERKRLRQDKAFKAYRKNL